VLAHQSANPKGANQQDAGRITGVGMTNDPLLQCQAKRHCSSWYYCGSWYPNASLKAERKS
ncbi:MAG TPA: hypothetical protein DEF45_01720, partial [Rhodopirellula sp.]|nr:hypothetical protein [Rhodopirellula sp.]